MSNTIKVSGADQIHIVEDVSHLTWDDTGILSLTGLDGEFRAVFAPGRWSSAIKEREVDGG